MIGFPVAILGLFVAFLSTLFELGFCCVWFVVCAVFLGACGAAWGTVALYEHIKADMGPPGGRRI